MSNVQGASSSLPTSGSGNESTLVHNIGQLKVPQLKELCRSLGLSPVAKRKQDLYERILHFIDTNHLADNGAELLAIDLLVMKLLNNDSIPSFVQLVQSMRSGIINQQGVSNSMQQYRQANGLSRSMAPRSMPTNNSQLRHSGYNSQLAPEDTYNGPMLLFRSTLLYNIRSAVGPAQVLRASKGRFAKQFALRLSPSELQLLNSSKDMKLYIFSGVESTPDSSNAQIQFPPIEIYVDGVLTKQFLRGIKGKAGTARPADITPYITRDSKPSHVRIVYSDANEKFILYPHIVEEFQPSAVVERIDARPHISAIHTKQKIKQESEAADDDDIQVATAFFSLRCPITYARIKYPFTSVECDHIQCFDGLSFLTMQQRIPSWQCPVCSKTIREDSLCVSDYIKEILDSVPEEVDTVKLETDGSWTIASEEDLKAEASKTQFEERPTNAKETSAEENIEVISLDSDSEEEIESPARKDQNETVFEATSASTSTPEPPVSPVIDENNATTKQTSESPPSAKVSDSGLPQTQAMGLVSASPPQSDAHPVEGISAVPETWHQTISNDNAPATADSYQDSDDDRVLATYRRATRPKIAMVAPSESHVGSRPDTPETNNTSDLTPFSELTGFNEAVNTIPHTVPDTVQQADVTMGADEAPSVEDTNSKVPAPLDPPGDSTVEKHFTNSITPGSCNISANKDKEPSEKTQTLHHEGLNTSSTGPLNTSTPRPSQNQEKEKENYTAIQIQPQRSQESVTEKEQDTANPESSQGEMHIIRHPPHPLNGNSIISTIQDQISRSASPSVSMSPKTTAVFTPIAPNASNESSSVTNLTHKTQNSKSSEYPPTLSSTKTDLLSQKWSTMSGTSAQSSSKHFRPIAKRGVENVYANPDGSQSFESRGPPRATNQNIPAFYTPIYGYGSSSSQQSHTQGSNFNPYVSGNPSSTYIGNSNHAEERSQARSNYESRMNQAYHNFRSHGVPQDSPSSVRQNENIPFREHPDSSWNHIYGLNDSQNAQMARNTHSFSRSVSFNGQYQGNSISRFPSTPYSQLIATSSNKINAYNQSMSNSLRTAVRPPPSARSISSIAKNTAFEHLYQRPNPGKDSVPAAAGLATPAMASESPNNPTKTNSEPAISQTSHVPESLRRVGASPNTLPAMGRRQSNGNVPNVDQMPAVTPAQHSHIASQSPETAPSSVVPVPTDKPPTMLKGLLGIEIASNALSSVEPHSDPISESNSLSHDDQNSTAISLGSHIQDMSLQTPANRKRSIDEPSVSSKRSSRAEKFNINDINSSDIIELESD